MRRPLPKRLLLLLLLIVLPARAQTPSTAPAPPATSAPLPVGGVIDLTHLPWRVRCGDNPSWSSPTFDDSQWAIVDPSKPLPAEVPRRADITCWYRLHIQLSPALANLGLLTFYGASDYDLFVNGEKVGTTGGMPPIRHRMVLFNHISPVPAGSIASGRAVIALRAWTYATTGLPPSPGVLFNVRIGLLPELQNITQNMLLGATVFMWATILGAVVSLFALGYFLMNRGRTEYLWLAVYGFAFVLAGIHTETSLYIAQPALLWSLLVTFFNCFIPFAFIQFFAAFLGFRGRALALIRLLQGFLFIPLLLTPFAVYGHINLSYPLNFLAMAFLLGSLTLFILLFIEYRRHNPEAAILILPTTLALGFYNLGSLLQVLGMAHINTAPYVRRYLFFNWGFLPVSVYSVALSCFWLAMGLIMLLRTNRANRQQARLSAELEAARSVQRLLLAEETAPTPGFTVESIYLPAAEVGGDFFLTRPFTDGSLLVILGDVSGKGVPAALAVSTIIGALRGCELRSPGPVLTYLNRVLHHHISGFATCCALYLSPLVDGQGTCFVANAGHIPPYRNGRALELPGDLPLAILPDSTYDEAAFRFAPGDRFTILSDGVLEATNANYELFGFDRTEAISNQPAKHIGETARAFGQEDDITVVSLLVDTLY
jgi:hypothetical protein